MNNQKVLVIFLLPIIIMLWGIGWFLCWAGEWLYCKSKLQYDNSLVILKKEGIET